MAWKKSLTDTGWLGLPPHGPAQKVGDPVVTTLIEASMDVAPERDMGEFQR